MEPEWDPQKARLNPRKHGVDFADAAIALCDDHAITIRDEHPHEERYVSIGSDTHERVLVVVYTWRDDRLRLISARRATRRERLQYEEGAR